MPGTSVSGKSPSLAAARSWQKAWSIIKMNSSNMDKFNKFDKIEFLQKIGLLNARFNSETLKFEPSWSLRLWSYLITLMKITIAKIAVSYLFEQKDEIQLLIGNPYNFFELGPKFFVSFAALAAASWGIGQHYVFNHLNSRNDYFLYRQWMHFTQEIPPKKNERPFGVSRAENDKFWRTVDRLNGVFYLVISYLVVPLSMVLNVGLFVVHFERLNFWLFILIQVVNCWHIPTFFFYFFHGVHTINLLYLEVMWILMKKFNSIARRTAKLNSRGTKKNSNRILSNLLFEHNKVHIELQEMNAFFSNFMAMNLVHLFGYGIMVAFVGLFLDWRLKIAFSLIMLGLTVTVIFLPFGVANMTKTEIIRAKRQFENAAFRPSIYLVIKQKISSISNLDDKAGLYCADWFPLSSFTGLLLTLELIVLLLLLIQAYFLYTNFKSSDLVF